MKVGFNYGRTRQPGDYGAAGENAALACQLRRLRALEDPANTSGEARCYREMVEAADARIRSGGREPQHAYGSGTLR